MAPFWSPFLIPGIFSEKFMWVPFLASFPQEWRIIRFAQGWFPKLGGFGGCSLLPQTDYIRGHIQMFPGTQTHRKFDLGSDAERTFPGTKTKTGTRVHSPNPPSVYELTLPFCFDLKERCSQIFKEPLNHVTVNYM